MKIKLIRMPSVVINPNWAFDFAAPSILPLSVGILAGKLRSEGYFVDVDDLNIKVHYNNYQGYKEKIDLKIFLDFKRILDYIRGKEDSTLESAMERILAKTKMDGYDLYLLSFKDEYHEDNCKSIFLSFIYYIKKKFGKTIIAGGISGGRYNLLAHIKDKNILDYLILGYGEESIIKLLDCIRNNKNYREIEGLVFYKGKILPENFCRRYNFNIQPDFDGLPFEKYKRKINHKEIFILPFKLNVGCKGICAFCAESGLIKKYNKAIEPKTAVKFIKNLKEKYKTPFFSLFDTTFNISRRYVVEFCEEILENNLKIYWNDCARFDANSLDNKTLKLLREAGCISLLFGLESASQKILDYIEKGITLDEAYSILKKSSQVGIWNGIELISGLPYENDKDIESTIHFINKHKNCIDEYWLNAFTLRSSSRFAINPKKYDLENIKQSKKRSSTGFGKGLDYQNITLEFDETNGFKWELKRKQINKSFNKLSEGIKIPYHIQAFNHYPVLFYLYSKYDDKEKIKKEYYKIKRNIIFKSIMNPRFIYWQLRSTSGIKMLMNKMRLR